MTSDPSLSPDRPGSGAFPGDQSPAPHAPLPSIPDGDAVIHEPPPPPVKSAGFTRAAALWTALIIGFLVLILLLVFILQNTGAETVHFLAWEWNLPLGVALLFSAIGGGLLTVAVGTVRIYQLRRATKKILKARR